MADVFFTGDTKNLIYRKYILFFGDSITRGLYKDLLVLYQRNQLISEAALSKKLPRVFEGDSLIHDIGLTRGRHFQEHRLFSSDGTDIEYFFITKVFCPDISKTLDEISKGQRRVPDVIAISSTLWDFTRWGADYVNLFKKNLNKLIMRFKESLPESTLVIWLTTPPICKVQGGFMITEVEFLQPHIRYEAMEANDFAHKMFAANGFDVLDFHFHLKLNVHWRNRDGVHWQSKAVRYMTNLLLTHISTSWGRELPGRYQSTLMENLRDHLVNLMEESENPVEEAMNEPVLSASVPMQECTQQPTQERVRIKAIHRLGVTVASSDLYPPEEDLRVKLQESKAINNKNCSNTNTKKNTTVCSSNKNKKVNTNKVNNEVSSNRIINTVYSIYKKKRNYAKNNNQAPRNKRNNGGFSQANAYHGDCRNQTNGNHRNSYQHQQMDNFRYLP